MNEKTSSFFVLFIQTISTSFFNYWLLLPRRFLNLILFPFTIHKRRKNRQIHGTKKLPTILVVLYGPIILISNLFDLLGVGEIMDIIFMIIKPKTRNLNPLEINALKQVFGNSLKSKQIRIDENSWIANKGAKLAGYPNIGMGLVLFRSINFNRTIDCANKTNDTAWLIHELTHVHQMQYIGIAYIFESLIAQHYLGYRLPKLDGNIHLNELNIEQQAEIAKYHYLYNIVKEEGHQHLSNLIYQLRKGKYS